jgi:hypothetical protein
MLESDDLEKSVPKGRLNLAQDAVLGCHSSSKSPEGTTEKLSETWSWVRGADREFSITRHSETEMLGIVFWGNFQSSLRDWLVSRISSQDYVLG